MIRSMFRLRRRLLTFAAAVSLMPGVAVLALWVRSYYADDLVEWQEPGDAPFLIHDVWANAGSFHVVADVRTMRDGEEDGEARAMPAARVWKVWHRPAEPVYHFDPPLGWNRLGFWYEQGDAHGERWTIPMWPAALVFALLPVTRIGVVLARRRHSKRDQSAPPCGPATAGP